MVPVLVLVCLVFVNIGFKLLLVNSETQRINMGSIEVVASEFEKNPVSLLLPMSVNGRSLYSPSGMVPLVVLKSMLGFNGAYIAINTFFIITLFACSYFYKKDILFSFFVSVFWVFNEPIIHLFYIGGLLVGYVFLVYLTLNMFFLVKVFSSPSSKMYPVLFLASLVLLLLSWEHALNYVVFLYSLLVVFMMLTNHCAKKMVPRYARLLSVATLISLAYFIVRFHFSGDIRAKGSEDELLFTSNSYWILVEDFVANAFTYLYMAATYIMPLSVVQSNALVFLGKQGIMFNLNGWPDPYFLSFYHSVFFWQNMAGAIFAAYIFMLFKLFVRMRDDPSVDNFSLFFLALFILIGSSVHLLIKFRPYMSIPILAYKGVSSIFALSIFVAYVISVMRQKNKAFANTLMVMFVICFMVNGVFRPRLYNYTSSVIWTSVSYPDPVALIQDRIGSN